MQNQLTVWAYAPIHVNAVKNMKRRRGLVVKKGRTQTIKHPVVFQMLNKMMETVVQLIPAPLSSSAG